MPVSDREIEARKKVGVNCIEGCYNCSVQDRCTWWTGTQVKEELCPKCGLVLVEGYRCECGYLSESAKKRLIRLFKERSNDPYPHFWEVCHYFHVWKWFRMIDILFPLDGGGKMKRQFNCQLHNNKCIMTYDEIKKESLAQCYTCQYNPGRITHKDKEGKNEGEKTGS